jgi:hypothetical protein
MDQLRDAALAEAMPTPAAAVILPKIEAVAQAHRELLTEADAASETGRTTLQTWEGWSRAIEELRPYGVAVAPTESPPARPITDDSAPYMFRREAGGFRVRFGEGQGHVHDSLGGQYVYRLLRSPGKPISCAQLRGVESADTGTTDAQEHTIARRKVRADMEKTAAELQEARSAGDGDEEARLTEKWDALETEARRLTGLGGRPRRSISERDRVSVFMAIDRLIKNCQKDSMLSSFGRHIEVHIHRGADCVYRPPEPPPRLAILASNAARYKT